MLGVCHTALCTISDKDICFFSFHSQVRWRSEQPGLVKGVLAHGMGDGTRWSFKVCSNLNHSMVLWFCDNDTLVISVWENSISNILKRRRNSFYASLRKWISCALVHWICWKTLFKHCKFRNPSYSGIPLILMKSVSLLFLLLLLPDNFLSLHTGYTWINSIAIILWLIYSFLKPQFGLLNCHWTKRQ